MNSKQKLGDRRIVLWDIEYTSWKDSLKRGWDAEKNQYMEIVQIGAILVDSKTYKIEKEFNCFVRPKINSKLSNYFKKLTKISQQKIDNAKSFETVFKKFIKFIKDYPCYSYGKDFLILKENIKLNDLKIKINKKQFHDIRNIFKKKGVPVEKYHSGNFLNWFGIKYRKKEHDALSDSKSLLRGLKLIQ